MAMIARETELTRMILDAEVDYENKNSIDSNSNNNYLFKVILSVNSDERVNASDIVITGEWRDIFNILYHTNFIRTTQTIATDVESRGSSERTQYVISSIEIIDIVNK